jgi:hypothetical protein
MFAAIAPGAADIMRIFNNVGLPLSRIFPENLEGALFGAALRSTTEQILSWPPHSSCAR